MRRAQVTTVALVIVAGVAAGVFMLARNGEQNAWPGCVSREGCVTSLADRATFVTTTGRGPRNAALVPQANGAVSLVTLDGKRLWTLHTTSDQPPRLLAAGDIDGDHVTDYVLGLVRRGGAPAHCGADMIGTTLLLVVAGRTGRTWAPFRPARDICWTTPSFHYSTQQLTFGTVYVGDFTADRLGNEIVVVPYYATDGTVWNYAAKKRWRAVGTEQRRSFAYPSTARFDQAFNSTNSVQCSSASSTGSCFVEHSHVANAVFLPYGPGPTGLFVLTSARAVVYRPDLSPTSDVTWYPGGLSGNGGRNYGLVEAYRFAGRTRVDLIGGCSVVWTWKAMRGDAGPTGGDDDCGVVRHFERFDVSGTRIRSHRTVYYGYVGSQGALEGRIEYPGTPRAPLGGPGTSWTVFNVLRGGTWTVQLFRGPNATQPHETRGWFVWDTVHIGRGAADLLATRIETGTMVTPWQFDVLRWDGSRLRSVQHVDGAVPLLTRMPSTSSIHSQESGRFGVFVDDGDQRSVLVADPSGGTRFQRLKPDR
jgi:hypothetical protein